MGIKFQRVIHACSLLETKNILDSFITYLDIIYLRRFEKNKIKINKYSQSFYLQPKSRVGRAKGLTGGGEKFTLHRAMQSLIIIILLSPLAVYNIRHPFIN